MTLETRFSPGDVVTHITDENTRGVITAFMVRGANHSYEIQWGVEKSGWHLDYELILTENQRKPIGFWRER